MDGPLPDDVGGVALSHPECEVRNGFITGTGHLLVPGLRKQCLILRTKRLV